MTSSNQNQQCQFCSEVKSSVICNGDYRRDGMPIYACKDCHPMTCSEGGRCSQNQTTDAELESLYRRCDVSNNGTEDPVNFEEFKAALLSWRNTTSIPREKVVEAIGELRTHPNEDRPVIYISDLESALGLTEGKSDA